MLLAGFVGVDDGLDVGVPNPVKTQIDLPLGVHTLVSNNGQVVSGSIKSGHMTHSAVPSLEHLEYLPGSVQVMAAVVHGMHVVFPSVPHLGYLSGVHVFETCWKSAQFAHVQIPFESRDEYVPVGHDMHVVFPSDPHLGYLSGAHVDETSLKSAQFTHDVFPSF